MPVMTFMLLPPVLPFSLPLLNLCVRDGNDALRQPLESLKWRFSFRRLGLWHDAMVFHAQPKRNLRLLRDFDLYRFVVVDDHGNRFHTSTNDRTIGSRLPYGRHADKDQNQHGENSGKQKCVENSEQCVHPASYATA